MSCTGDNPRGKIIPLPSNQSLREGGDVEMQRIEEIDPAPQKVGDTSGKGINRT